MPRLILVLPVAAVVWIGWCILSVTVLVPHIRRHITMWDWLMAYVLCLLPVILAGFIAVSRVRSRA